MTEFEYDPDTSDSKDWTNPVNMLAIRDAVREHHKQVTLNGHIFVIKYDSQKVYVKIQNDYAPCGWFTYEELEKYNPEGDFK